MPIFKSCKANNAGFSLIEVMVGMVIGLISMVIVMQVFTTFEGQKRTTTSGSDAQSNGGLALYTLERDVRMAGYGFSDAIGCKVNTAQKTLINQTTGSASYTSTPPYFILTPVVITQGASGLSDTISVMASDKQSWSVPVGGSNHAQSNPALSFTASSTLGMSPNDLLIAYETSNGALIKDCTMFQISNPANANNTVANPVLHNAGNWNNNLVFPNPDYTVNSMLLNMGKLMLHYYSLDAQNNLIAKEYDSVNNPGGPNANDPDQILYPDIVNFQAQYGFDTRSAATIQAQCPSGILSGQCSIVGVWSDTMMDADGSGVTGDAGDISRIYAIRFVVVARSEQMEKPDQTTGVCNTTTANPTWAGSVSSNDIWYNGNILANGTADPLGLISLSADVNWKCYRYKTFETVVPLRNSIWKQR